MTKVKIKSFGQKIGIRSAANNKTTDSGIARQPEIHECTNDVSKSKNGIRKTNTKKGLFCCSFITDVLVKFRPVVL